MNSSMKRYFACWRSSPLEPDGTYTDTTDSLP